MKRIDNKIYSVSDELIGEPKDLQATEEGLSVTLPSGEIVFVHKDRFSSDDLEIYWAVLNYQESNVPIIDIEILKQSKIQEAISYRWEKQLWFEYDGHLQRWDTYDIVRIGDSATALQSGAMTSIKWKYGDADYVTVTDPTYFINMKMAGYTWEQLLRSVEKSIIEQINAVTDVEELTAFNVELTFEELLTLQ